MPDALDLLTISGARQGLGFDAALAKVVEKWDNPLTEEFGRVLAEIRVGKLRREALRDMSERTEVPELKSFVAAIIQADQLGASIGRILHVQAAQMRMKRRQRAEEAARKAPHQDAHPAGLPHHARPLHRPARAGRDQREELRRSVHDVAPCGSAPAQPSCSRRMAPGSAIPTPLLGLRFGGSVALPRLPVCMPFTA